MSQAHKGSIDRRLEQLPLLADRRALTYAIAIAVSALAWGIRWALNDIFPPGSPFVTLFPAVILTAFLLGRGPGIVTAIVGGFAAWYVFVPTGRTLSLDRTSVVTMIFYIGIVGVEITLISWMQRINTRLIAERERSRALAERSELLFRELQHRVANNIQMIGAVLALQIRQTSDDDARHALGDAAAKLQMIGRIQRQLYDPSGAPLALDVFLVDLVADLVTAGGKPGVRHTIDADPGVVLPPAAAIPVALVLAEAIANAIEHGFANCEEGHIAIALTRSDTHLDLTVTDDGCGLPKDFDDSASTSLGLRIARTLATQLDARFSLEPHQKGTRMLLSVPLVQPEPA